MNYRHVYHAGNFADVLKHVVLALVITHLKKKETPFRVIDTHAGIGVYDLTSEAAQKTGEWRDGIARIWGEGAGPLPDDVRALLAPYLDVVSALNPDGRLSVYPGSPEVARSLLRRGDQLVANELHPDDAATLAAHFNDDRQVKTLSLDGWIALKSLLPPKERRGVVLIDPPFEQPRELDRMIEGVREGLKRFATGIYLLWYPIKDPRVIARFAQMSVALAPKVLRAEVVIREPRQIDVLNGTGLIILNPPWQLDEEIDRILPFLARRLAQGQGADSALEWLASPE